jgi:drug/metabolite transporter (DMT)-like permease
MKLNKWFYLAALSFIWGSSFILIKKGLVGLTAIELGSIRIIISAFVLVPFTFKRLKEITFKQWKWIIISAFVGSFFPAFLFAFAEQEIDSSVASILNSIVPLNTIIIGLVLFGIKSTKRQIIGVLLGFFGAYQLIISGINLNPDQNYFYSGLVIICSFLYAFNVNIIKKYLQELSAVAIATGHFIVILIPSVIVLLISDFNFEKLQNPQTQTSLFYVTLLAIFGTTLAKILFNKLINISSAVFASSVTYSMLIVSIFWGVMDGENFSINQLFATIIIVIGILLTNKKSKN